MAIQIGTVNHNGGVQIGIDRVANRWPPQSVAAAEPNITVSFHDIGKTPTHTARFDFLDVGQIFFTGDQHRSQDHQQLRSTFDFLVVLEEMPEQRDISDDRNFGAGHDLWQKAILGIAQVGSEQGYVDAALHEVVAYIEGLRIAELGAQDLEFLHY